MKVTKKDFIGSFDGLNREEKAFMEKNADMMCNIVNKAMEGAITSDEVEERMKSVVDSLKEENETLRKSLKETEDIVKNLADEAEKAKSRGVNIAKANAFLDKFEAMMETSKMKALIDGVDKTSGWFDGFSLKDITNISSMENNYDGEILISRQSDVVANRFANPKMSVRDFIRVIPGDAQQPNFTFLQVDKFDRNAQYETENGRLKQSNLSFKEITVAPRRLGSYFDLSKNLLLARTQLRAFLIANIPGIITQAENASILFGDGKNNSLNGIVNTEGVISIEKQITDTIVSGKAGDVVKVYESKRGILVEFKNALSDALDSMMITFVGAAVNTDLNSANPIVKINDHQVIVLGAEYKGEETATSTMTFTIKHASFKSVEDPNSRDVVAAIFACLSFAQYTPNLIVLNPLTVFAMETEKDAMGRGLDLVQNVNGQKYIAGVPVVECSAMPVGHYLAGDFENGCNLYDYTSLEMQFAEDAETVLRNMVRLWFQIQLALVVYMPWAFAYGKLEDLKTAITKDDGTSTLGDTVIKTDA